MAVERSFKFHIFSDDYYRVINQAGVRQRLGLCGIDYCSCWDTNLSPDGTLYYAAADESGRCRHTRLIAYDYVTDTAKVCLEAEKIALPTPRQFPISKLHESITFLPDGRVFATTHSTSRPLHHPEWMPFAHHTHPWEGWPGSTMLCYDPKTGKAENWGVPVPRESIYGATYDAKHNAIYMIGFMLGHVYRFSLDDHSIKDLGKAAENCCYRLHVGPDQHIYACTKSGFLWRVNVDTERIEDLNWRVPEYPDNYCNNTWYRWMSHAHNVDNRTIIFTTFCSDEIFKLDTITLKVTPIGRKTMFDEFVDYMPVTSAINEFAIDKYGVLWYAIFLFPLQKPANDFRSYQMPSYLMRWDYLNGETPECLGAVGTPEYMHSQTSGLCLDKEKDILYMVGGNSNSGSGLSVICVDLAKFRPHMHIPGPISEDKLFRPRNMTPAEIEAYKKRGKATEEVTATNPYYAFPIETITPVRLWRHVPHTHIEDSKVIGLVWDDHNVLHGLCGENRKYCFKIKNKMIDVFMPLDEADEKYKAWLLANIHPESFDFDENMTLPSVAGRQYLAKASAVAEWNGERRIVGTKDGLLAIVHNSEVFSLGNAAPYGPVRCLCTNTAKTRVWGTAGDDEDLGTVFYYDDKIGLRQLGFVIYNIHGYFDGPSASNILSSIAVSNDESLIAVGGADRMGAIHIADL